MRRFPVIDYIYLASEWLMRILPDWITGKSEVMARKYNMKYGPGDYSRMIRRNKTRTMAYYLVITSVFLIVSAWSFLLLMGERKEITNLQRPAFGAPAESVAVEVHMKYKEHELIKDVTIKVKPEELGDAEKRKLLREYALKMEDRILGENMDLEHVSKPLNLTEREMASGITISWQSSHPELVGETGEVNLIGAADKQEVELLAELNLDDISVSKVIRLKLDTEAGEEDYKRSLTDRLEQGIARLAHTGGSDSISLPGELGDGVEVRWLTDKDNYTALFSAAFLIAVMIVYLKRYGPIDKEIREAKESIVRDLPEFINKLVLLLNAGLVVSAAFTKITRDYEAFYHTGTPDKRRKKRYLYEVLLEMEKRVSRSNTSLIRELREFSQRCGVREMVRLTAVISDNWNKGSTLAEKLEGEGALLWTARKKCAEEKGRLAETKLTFPLMILLIILIMITIAPAMMEM